MQRNFYKKHLTFDSDIESYHKILYDAQKEDKGIWKFY